MALHALCDFPNLSHSLSRRAFLALTHHRRPGMAKKEIKKFFSFGKNRRASSSAAASADDGAGKGTSVRRSISSQLMADNVAAAEAIISKLGAEDSPYAKFTSLFSHGRAEASRYLHAVADLHSAMIFFSSADCPEGPASRAKTLFRSQTLMQTAMRRLEKEFHRILAANRDRLDPESLSAGSFSGARGSVGGYGSGSPSTDGDDDIQEASGSIGDVEQASVSAAADLRSIAETMIACGYGRECVRVYKLLRKSIVDEGLYKLGFDRLSNSQIHKLDWPVLDLKIRSWLAAAGPAIATLFSGERLLCDIVFCSEHYIAESCLADVTRDAALLFLAFPESVVKTKRSPEKILRILDLHRKLTDLWPEIESVFSAESTFAVKAQALDSLAAVSGAAIDTIAEFEVSVQKEASKLPVPRCSVHPLTRNAMNYLCILADYVPTLADVYAGVPFHPPEPMPESSSPCPSTLTPAAVSDRIAWLLLLLLCKLDHKAEFYSDVSLSYLFLANNVKYVVNRVRASRLKMVVGERWAARHEERAWHYAESFVRLLWGPPASVVSVGEANWEAVLAFNRTFEEAARIYEDQVVVDSGMREELLATVEEMMTPAYELLRRQARAASPGVRYSPPDIRVRLKQLFVGPDGSD
ncbi:hypothetical protein AXF42_Ash017736 [Apostasia shenzhenica]|uniref:Exocyst subunit Exo70 family protein n=1 Tax=Apostasia shenzhenica TaxID=1088818 RepID=A0A2I0B639_9ASPA|nr:hypothetical protein AXF42_Ash017736 [Apostasia shenzhenica]